MTERKQATIELLRGVSSFFAGREAADGSVVCPRHGLEHTGRVVYSASIDLALLEATGEEKYRERIRRRALRTLIMAREEPKTGRAIFFPGGQDRRNASSDLIDSGACCDVLSEVLERAPELFTAADRERFVAAIGNVCDSFLMEAVLSGDLPCERLWGATGLARASRALSRPRYGERAREAVRTVVASAHNDGSLPHLPDPDEKGEHVGLSDISVYNHSRHLCFIAYIYDCLDEGYEDVVGEFMSKAQEFLCALYGREGRKQLCNEARQWYWESSYEVASHPFDIHALLAAKPPREDPRGPFVADLAWRQLLEHVDPEDGGIHSHRGDEQNFQCRDVWNGHVAWLARLGSEVPVQSEEPPFNGIRSYDDSGMVRVERRDYVALLRGKKQPINISYGGEAGGGSLIYFGRRESGYVDQVKIPKWTSLAPGNYVATPRDRPSFKQRVMSFYRDNRNDLRFRLYLANLERKAGNTRKALEYPLRHVVNKLRDEMKGRYASHFDISPSLSWNDNELVYSSMLCRRDGTVMRGSALTRRYLFGELELEVEDSLTLEQPVRAVVYECLSGLRDLQIRTVVPYRNNEGTIIFQPGAFPAKISVWYRI